MDTVQATGDSRCDGGDTAGDSAGPGRCRTPGLVARPGRPARSGRIGWAWLMCLTRRPYAAHALSRGGVIAGPPGDGVTATRRSAD